MTEEKHFNAPDRFSESPIKGEKMIFDIPIKDKLAHVIVVKSGDRYHINLDAEDLGYFIREDGGHINRHPQPKGAHLDVEAYFEPIEDKLKEMGVL